MKPSHMKHLNKIDQGAQRGIGMVAAIVVLVLLASLAAAVTRLSWTQQVSSAQDIAGARAFQAANAGVEWGMYQALRGSWIQGGCNGSSQTIDLTSTMGFKVTVTCTSQSTAFKEGQDTNGTDLTLYLYMIDAVACNGSAASCPDNASSGGMNYVERKRHGVVSCRSDDNNGNTPNCTAAH